MVKKTKFEYYGKKTVCRAEAEYTLKKEVAYQLKRVADILEARFEK